MAKERTLFKARTDALRYARHASCLAAVLVAAGLMSACGALGSGPKYERPALAVPDSLGPLTPGLPATPASTVDWLNWWKSFQDPVLDALLVEAQAQSQDLALASARIAEARATLDQNEANLYPTLDLNASSTRVLAVPLKSVRTDQVQPFVQLVREGKVHHQTVTLGLRGMADSEEMVAVEGLREGDLLIKGATGLLRQGSKVLFTPNTPAAAAAIPPAAAGAAR
jgi:hypothetical protein